MSQPARKQDDDETPDFLLKQLTTYLEKVSDVINLTPLIEVRFVDVIDPCVLGNYFNERAYE